MAAPRRNKQRSIQHDFRPGDAQNDAAMQFITAIAVHDTDINDYASLAAQQIMSVTRNFLGPMIDCGAPYPPVGAVELAIIQFFLKSP